MYENYNMLRRRSSSLAYSAKQDRSVDISRLSTAVCSSKKGTSPSSFNKYIFDQNNFRLLTEKSLSNQKYSNSNSILQKPKRRDSITPQQLFTDNYDQYRYISTNQCNQCNCHKKPTINQVVKKEQPPIPKKMIKRSQSVVKEGQQQKKQVETLSKKQGKIKKQESSKEKIVLKKKINRLTTQIQEEDDRQKENELHFVSNIETIKAKIGIIQQKRSLSETKQLNAHECARDQLEQRTKEFYEMQSNFQAMYSNMVEKHHQDQVNWSVVYTNLLKDKTNLKKNILIKSKLK